MTKFNKHLVIVGTARSGTSWLSEMISRQHRYRLLFEPEHYTKTKKGHLICDQWIENKSGSKEAYSYLKKVFLNRVDNDWIAQNSNRKFKRHLWPWIPKKYIAKFVRANLSAKFINEIMEVPVLHVLRSPYDVVRSQKRSKFPWILDLSIFASQDKLTQFIKDHYEIDISQVDNISEVELMTLRWCIENVIPLEGHNGYQGQARVIKYEDIVSNIDLFIELCHFFDLIPITNLEASYRQPSTKTHPESSIRHGEVQKGALSNDEIIKINGILDRFNTKLYDRIIPN